ncbi:MAG: helix-turn-helix domain-containing protein [Patescibacteria group bacterium]|jgi:cytoskeletal protein RodZ
MSEFSSKQILSNRTLGDKLKRARKDSGLSLEQVAKKIQINKEYLGFLENGQYNQLPSPLFIKNYLKKYSQFLRLNWFTMERLLAREMVIYKEKHPAKPATKYNQKALVIPKLLVALLIIFGLVALSSYLIYEVGNFVQPPDLIVNNLPDQLTTKEHAITIAGQTEADTQVFINGQVILTDKEGNFEETISLRTGLNTIKIVAKKTHSKERIIYKQILVETNQ